MSTLAQTLTGLFTEKTLIAWTRAVAPYQQLATGVHVGFEPDAHVEVTTRPKDDFTRSPDACLDTLVIAFHGPSRWLTIEATFEWAELANASQYQIGVYARPDRTVTCRGVLRLPSGHAASDGFEDVSLCELRLAPGDRSAHGQGQLAVALPETPSSEPPKLLLFFDSATDLRMEVDFVTAYFA